MRKLLHFIISLLALQAAAYAGDWTFNSQWLFLSPSIDDSYFVASGVFQDAPNGTRRNNNFGFRPATRVKVAYAEPCNDFYVAVFYTNLYARKNRTIRGAELVQTDSYATGVLINYTGNAISRNQIIYNGIDLLFLKSLWNPSCFQLNLLFGAEYAYSSMYQVNIYNAPNNLFAQDKFTRRNRFWGIGPELGFDLEYRLARVDWFCPGQFNFNFLSIGSLLASNVVAWQSSKLTTLGFSVVTRKLRDEPTWRIVPAFHARCGISYDMVFSCVRASLEIGYELNTYIRAFAKPILHFNTFQVTNEYLNFNTQGPFGGLNLTF